MKTDKSITVFERLKSLSLEEMASLLSRMCKNAETCDKCPFEAVDDWDCPCSESIDDWIEFLKGDANNERKK